MAITTIAPYTSANTVITVIRRFRDKGLSLPITADVLLRAGVSDSLIPRTLQALVILDLIDEAGQPTTTFQKMRVVPEAEFQGCLADWLASAYAEVFKFVDPQTDDVTRVRDAFRTYTPHGQQDRMVALFMGLCAEAGLVAENKKSESKPSVRRVAPIRGSGPTTRAKKMMNAPVVSPSTRTHVEVNGFPPALAGLLQSIPSGDSGWTQLQRDKFLTTFAAVLDFVVPVVAEVHHQVDETQGNDDGLD